VASCLIAGRGGCLRGAFEDKESAIVFHGCGSETIGEMGDGAVLISRADIADLRTGFLIAFVAKSSRCHYATFKCSIFVQPTCGGPCGEHHLIFG
jgi:hypothetical protein